MADLISVEVLARDGNAFAFKVVDVENNKEYMVKGERALFADAHARIMSAHADAPLTFPDEKQSPEDECTAIGLWLKQAVNWKGADDQLQEVSDLLGSPSAHVLGAQSEAEISMAGEGEGEGVEMKAAGPGGLQPPGMGSTAKRTVKDVDGFEDIHPNHVGRIPSREEVLSSGGKRPSKKDIQRMTKEDQQLREYYGEAAYRKLKEREQIEETRRALRKAGSKSCEAWACYKTEKRVEEHKAMERYYSESALQKIKEADEEEIRRKLLTMQSSHSFRAFATLRKDERKDEMLLVQQSGYFSESAMQKLQQAEDGNERHELKRKKTDLQKRQKSASRRALDKLSKSLSRMEMDD